MLRGRATQTIWRLRIQAGTRDLQAHVFVLNCSGQLPWSPCVVVRQTSLHNGQATLSINDPEASEWRVAILPDNDLSAQSYDLEHVMLKPTATGKDSKLPNSATGEVMIPSNLVAESAGENLSYAAFRLAPIGEQEKGTLIAGTPLDVRSDNSCSGLVRAGWREALSSIRARLWYKHYFNKQL